MDLDTALPRLTRMAASLIAAANPDNRSLHAALGRAQERLSNRTWEMEQGLLRIRSESQPTVMHITDGIRCECKTRRPDVCWHIAAWKLIIVLIAACGLEPNEIGVVTIKFPGQTEE